MLLKVSRFNQLPDRKEDLKGRYSRLEQVAKERDIQVASLGSLAGEVSSLYGLKRIRWLVANSPDEIQIRRFRLRLTSFMLCGHRPQRRDHDRYLAWAYRNVTTADWFEPIRLPILACGRHVTGSFGERIDPFNGEGAFHSGWISQRRMVKA